MGMSKKSADKDETKRALMFLESRVKLQHNLDKCTHRCSHSRRQGRNRSIVCDKAMDVCCMLHIPGQI